LGGRATAGAARAVKPSLVVGNSLPGSAADPRVTTAVVLLIAAGSLSALGLYPVPCVLIGASIVFGLTVGNATTLSPIIVRREFGAQAFGLVFGVASCGIQLATTLGPSLYGFLHDAFGSCNPADRRGGQGGGCASRTLHRSAKGQAASF
jgi:cyanate permease